MVRLTRLKIVRERKALTQEQLAQTAGISRATLARIEAGANDPYPTTVRKLADALAVDPQQLMEPEPIAESSRNDVWAPERVESETAPLRTNAEPPPTTPGEQGEGPKSDS